jgi:tetratricopeptide (TPR) repeat protein
MNNSLHYIDDYFTGVMNNDEKKAFVQRCLTDHDFAKEVAQYISIRDGLNARLQQQKKEEFAKLHQELAAAPVKPAKIFTLKSITYLAAASVLLIIGWFAFFQQANPQKIADKYITTNLNTLGLNMGSSDSLQAGIAAYNSRSYPQAERLFKLLINKQETAPEAVKYLGLTHLAMKQYSEALENFDQLSGMSLHTNPGAFYKALTLMARSEGSDTQQAKKTLQEIINKNLYGNQEARNWIKQIKN